MLFIVLFCHPNAPTLATFVHEATAILLVATAQQGNLVTSASALHRYSSLWITAFTNKAFIVTRRQSFRVCALVHRGALQAESKIQDSMFATTSVIRLVDCNGSVGGPIFPRGVRQLHAAKQWKTRPPLATLGNGHVSRPTQQNSWSSADKSREIYCQVSLCFYEINKDFSSLICLLGSCSHVRRR